MKRLICFGTTLWLLPVALLFILITVAVVLFVIPWVVGQMGTFELDETRREVLGALNQIAIVSFLGSILLLLVKLWERDQVGRDRQRADYRASLDQIRNFDKELVAAYHEVKRIRSEIRGRENGPIDGDWAVLADAMEDLGVLRSSAKHLPLGEQAQQCVRCCIEQMAKYLSGIVETKRVKCLTDKRRKQQEDEDDGRNVGCPDNRLDRSNFNYFVEYYARARVHLKGEVKLPER